MFDDVIAVRVRPNKHVTEYTGYDTHRECHVFTLNAPKEKGKANKELISYCKKEHGLHAEIISGHTSQNKLVRLTPLLQKNL